jgi:hypothetical protein
MRNLKKNRGKNIKDLKPEIDLYKQSQTASDYILQYGSLGLSTKAEEARKRLLKVYTDKNFKGRNLLTGEELQERDNREEREALYGEEGAKLIHNIPRLQFRSKSDLIRALSGEENIREGSVRRDFDKVIEELKQERDFTFIKKTGNITEKAYYNGALFSFQTVGRVRTKETEAGEQEELFSEEVIIVTIANELLIREIEKNYTMLPVNSTELLSGQKQDRKLTKRENTLIDYFTLLYESRHSYEKKEKKSAVNKIDLDKLMKLTGVSEKSLSGKNRNRSKIVKEFLEALKLCESLVFIERIDYSSESNTVKVFFR